MTTKFVFIIFFIILFCDGYSNDYDQAYFNYSSENKQPTGVAIVAFNRPEYLKQLIQSIEKNRESLHLPFFFFLDGGPNAKQAENIQLIHESKIAIKVIILRDINYGCPKNHIDSKRFMFDWCKFKQVMVMEEDVIVSRFYFKTLLNLHRWAKKTYSNIGTVQLWSYCSMPVSKKQQCIKFVKETMPEWSLVAYCLDHEVWNAISPLLYEFESCFCDPLLGNDDYNYDRSKPARGIYSKDIKKWYSNKISGYDRKIILDNFDKKLPVLMSKVDYTDQGIINDGFNQDTITSAAIWLAGYTRLQTVVNRVMHIGKVGISTPARNKNRRENITSLDEFPYDPLIENFIMSN